MLIKVRPDFYINAEAIITVAFVTTAHMDKTSSDIAILKLNDNTSHKVSGTAGRYILELLEVNDAVLLPDDAESKPPTPALTTRIAQLLRDSVYGSTFKQILNSFPYPTHTQDTRDAIATLITENVVIPIPGNDEQFHYYHASNATAQEYLRWQRGDIESFTLTPNADPSAASEALPDVARPSAEYTD